VQSPGGTLTLIELANFTGNKAKSVFHGCEFSARHETAAVLHGWNSYEYNHGSLELSEDEYLAALSAAASGSVHAPADRKRR
jgi:hypothetical protein